MKPAGFDYVRAESLDEALEVLGRHGGDAKVLAGGQSLMPMLNIRLVQPKVLVDISRCADLDYIRVEHDQLVVGAAVTQSTLQAWPDLEKQVPLLPLVFPWISHFQIRNHGTVCGSVAHADPSAELPLCLSALQGEVVLRSSAGRRVLKAEKFFLGMLSTAIQVGDLIEEVRFPIHTGSARYAFEEVSMRHGDFAIVAVVARVDAASIRLTVGGVADRAQSRQWARLSAPDLELALNDFAWELGAQSDTQASAHYRRHLVRQLGQRVIERAQS